MLVTFVATTQLPLHMAILIGAITSLVLYCVKASQAAELIALERAEDGGWLVCRFPKRIESDAVTVLQYSGVGLVRRGAAYRRGVAAGRDHPTMPLWSSEFGRCPMCRRRRC